MGFRADFHIHTMFSGDSQAAPEEEIQAAAAKGLDKIIFTDHCECDDEKAFPPGVAPWEPLDLDGYTQSIAQIQNRFHNGPVQIGLGVELGGAAHNEPFARKVLSDYPWDFVIGSNHMVRGQYDFYYLDYRKTDTGKIFKQYFEELYELAELDLFDVLGHLYYFVRYAYRQGVEFDLRKYDADILAIFRKIIANGKGIEINTSDVDKAFGEPIPNLKYLKLFRQCGGEIVTIGSDAHDAAAVGRGQELAISLLREAGFRAIASFAGRKPVFQDIS